VHTRTGIDGHLDSTRSAQSRPTLSALEEGDAIDTLKLIFLGAFLVGLYLIGCGFAAHVVERSTPSAKTAEQLQAEYPLWSVRDCERVAQHMIWIRMTAEQALESWGSPKEVHRSTSEEGAVEQWVYPGGRHGSVYLYFGSGVLLTWAE